jgi:hypothetical protein
MLPSIRFLYSGDKNHTSLDVDHWMLTCIMCCGPEVDDREASTSASHQFPPVLFVYDRGALHWVPLSVDLSCDTGQVEGLRAEYVARSGPIESNDSFHNTVSP